MQRPNDLPIWAIPGGKIEHGETPEAAARRETVEETGYTIQIDGFVGEYWQPQIILSSTTFVYVGHVVGGQAIVRGVETRAVQWFSITALPWCLPSLYRHFIREALSRPTAPRRQAIYLSIPEAFIINTMRTARRWLARHH